MGFHLRLTINRPALIRPLLSKPYSAFSSVRPLLRQGIDIIAAALFELIPRRNRLAAGRTTYRYEYDGNFSNISPLPWMGAYHSGK